VELKMIRFWSGKRDPESQVEYNPKIKAIPGFALAWGFSV